MQNPGMQSASQLFKLAGRPVSAAALVALMAAGAPTGALAQDEGQPQVSVSEDELIDLAVKDEEISNVLELLSVQTQRNIVASRNVSGRVTANLYGVTFTEALGTILRVNGFTFVDEGKTIKVYTLEEYRRIEEELRRAQPKFAKVLKLNYLNATDAQTFVDPLKSEDGQIMTSAEAEAFSLPADIPTGAEDYALSATLVVFDYAENIAAIEDLLARLDTRPAQVLVESTILQTSLTEENAFGVDFSIIDDLEFTDFINLGGPLSAVNSLINGGTGQQGSGGLSPEDNSGTGIVSSPGNTGGPSTFKLGVVTDDVSIFVKMLDQVQDTMILANPKILTLNRQPSRVLVGRRVGYLNTTSTDTATTQTVEFLDTGTQLFFRPFVSADGEVRMELKPQVSEAIIREAADVNGAIVTIPDEVTQEIVTNVNVRDGQTVVLGGLFRESTQFARRQVPFVGDLPIVGAAFRGHDDETDRSEIIFMIKPSIVTDSLLASAADRAANDVERVRTGARQGLLPWSREKLSAAWNVQAEKYAREGNYDKAMFEIGRSLAINPYQPDIRRLRDRITGEREVWPNRSMLNGMFRAEITDRTGQVRPADPPVDNDLWIDNQMFIPKRESNMDDFPEVDQGGRQTPHLNFPASGNNNNNSGASAEPMHMDDSDDSYASSEETGWESSDTSESFADGEPVDGVAPIAPWELFDHEASVRYTLTTLRQHIDDYTLSHGGTTPALGFGDTGGWDPFIASGLLIDAPTNPLLSGPNASRVVVGDSPDCELHADYGWIFNPETGELWAAGFDMDDHLRAEFARASAVSASFFGTTFYFEDTDANAVAGVETDGQ